MTLGWFSLSAAQPCTLQQVIDWLSGSIIAYCHAINCCAIAINQIEYQMPPIVLSIENRPSHYYCARPGKVVLYTYGCGSYCCERGWARNNTVRVELIMVGRWVVMTTSFLLCVDRNRRSSVKRTFVKWKRRVPLPIFQLAVHVHRVTLLSPSACGARIWKRDGPRLRISSSIYELPLAARPAVLIRLLAGIIYLHTTPLK